jgi:acylphosphatase
MDQLRLQIRGRVQGVGYRAFVRREAAALRLNGVVRNLDDGSVEIEAEGPRADLERLLDRARRGPSHAEVRDVTSQWGEGASRFHDFRID